MTTNPHHGHPGPARWATQTAFSDPGRHAALIAAIPADPSSLRRLVTGVVVHYVAQAAELTDDQRADVSRRWAENLLDAAVERAGEDLLADRAPGCRVGGCCRDKGLLAVAVLRAHGIPARTRLGFAAYFARGFHHDHVVVERWDGARWVRSDPGLRLEDVPAGAPFDPDDLPTGEGAPYETAAEVWAGYRAGRLDPGAYGVAPDLPVLGGAQLVQRYVLGDLAHRQGHELLLWDAWGAQALPGLPMSDEQVALADRVAALTLAADAGGPGAESALADLWASDARVRPDGRVLTFAPLAPGDLPRVTDLAPAAPALSAEQMQPIGSSGDIWSALSAGGGGRGGEGLLVDWGPPFDRPRGV